MMPLDTIRNFFPVALRDNALFYKYMLKEYLQMMILDYLSGTVFVRNISLIGGTNLRLISGIDRFSEDLDFDCKKLTVEDFSEMTDGIIRFLQNSGINVEAKDRENRHLQAYRRNLHFPELLFGLGLSGHRDERFLIKVEAEDQKAVYNPEMVNIKGCGFIFPMTAPPQTVLCAMKIAAMLNRQKGRDFYDVIFLLSQTQPDYNFLEAKCAISNREALKKEAIRIIRNVDLKSKTRDFEHLLFNKNNSKRILQIESFFDAF
jgi:predicted nucleotidyltransferase component of viral defense system